MDDALTWRARRLVRLARPNGEVLLLLMSPLMRVRVGAHLVALVLFVCLN